MGLSYQNLDDLTRQLMVDELDLDLKNDVVYISNYLNDNGRNIWIDLLKEAIKSSSDDVLAEEVRRKYCLKEKTERRKPKGGFSLVSVPVTAAQTLAESQFNMYFMRALALRALQDGRKLMVYRAKETANPRAESELMIGTLLDPSVVLKVLRETKGVEPDIGIPLPNSGITVKLL